MNGLILHCGAQHVTRTELAVLPTPEARGTRHVIRPFIEDVELIHDLMNTQGIAIQDEAYGVLKDQEGIPQRFFGILQVRLDGINNDQYGLMIGLRGSYDQTLTRALAVGSRVFVCDNLAFSGEINASTRQTTHIADRIPIMLQNAISQIPALAHAQDTRFDAYRNSEITRKEGDALLIEMVRQQALLPSNLGQALHEWDKPSHDEHADQGYSIWRLQNAVTEAIKPANPERAAVPTTWIRTRRMTDILDQHLGIDAPALLAA